MTHRSCRFSLFTNGYWTAPVLLKKIKVCLQSEVEKILGFYANEVL